MSWKGDPVARVDVSQMDVNCDFLFESEKKDSGTQNKEMKKVPPTPRCLRLRGVQCLKLGLEKGVSGDDVGLALSPERQGQPAGLPRPDKEGRMAAPG